MVLYLGGCLQAARHSIWTSFKSHAENLKITNSWWDTCQEISGEYYLTFVEIFFHTQLTTTLTQLLRRCQLLILLACPWHFKETCDVQRKAPTSSNNLPPPKKKKSIAQTCKKEFLFVQYSFWRDVGFLECTETHKK